ncbi:WD40 repeat protein [Trypanosoma theileri]|uniref:WD40 repeat protein n=1 Tax=Trypanosoma theileri TaxID=67003 RepID=A0A1X0NTY1_9TRYP|nr:WD40 repeat protein [Trypanosoma theileri]ORC88071.1 WD40 repeat protein [Trypanosoma theileri]
MQAAAAYGLEFQARAIAPFYHPSNGSMTSHRFIVGTSCFAGGNKIHLLDYQDEARLLECTMVWFHEEEVYGLWSSPSLTEPSLLAVRSSSQSRVFRVPELISGELQEVASFAAATSQVLWDLEGLQNEVRVTAGSALIVYTLDEGRGGKEVSSFKVEGCKKINYAALDPHHSSVCIVACEGNGLYLIDTRKKQPVSIGNTNALHGFGQTRCIDFSSCQANILLSSGDDGFVLWHDIRMNGSECLAYKRRHLKAHDHIAHKALFNPFHDELLLSCGSDHTLKLWDASKQDASEEQAVCLRRLTDFADSVVDACWSSSGPWVFAGVSFNGRVIVDEVPKEKKMEILLKEN